MSMTLGIDVACRAEHQATLAIDGKPVWRGRKFITCTFDLDRIWGDLDVADPGELIVVLEPTRNAWLVLAQWFRRRGATVVMVPTTQSADLRKYYSKHAKNDRLDSEVLARLPLLHPEGLRAFTGDSSADPLRRLTKQRSTLVKRRTAVYSRLDALIELLGPAWYDVLGSNYTKSGLAFLTRYADPHAVLRLGEARLTRFLQARSRGQYGPAPAKALVAAARETLALWGPDGMDFAELGADIAVEAEQAIFLSAQIKEVDERLANFYAEADPDGIVASAPGVGPVTSAVIAGRIGDPARFTSLAAIRAYSGMVPRVNQSGLGEKRCGVTKAGDPLLREMLFLAADHARLVDPQLAAKYVRLMSGDRHRDSAICHLATDLLTRIAACMRTGQRYVIRDVDGRKLTEVEGRAIVRTKYKVDKKKRVAAAGRRMQQRRRQATGRESQKSLGAPTSRPVPASINPRQVA
jgi:transposase